MSIRTVTDYSETRAQVHVSDDGFSFSGALIAIKDGDKVARRNWNGKGMYVALLPASASSAMTRAYIYMKTVNNELVPWVASQTDLLADDWYIVA